MKAGEIWWVRIPEAAGHAQSGIRPAIVIQHDDLDGLPTVLVIPLTTRVAALRFPGTLLIEPCANGLSKPSVALAFQTTVVDKRFFSGRVGSLAAEDYAAVWSAFDMVTQRSL